MEVSFLKSAFHPEEFPLPDRPEVAFAGRSNVGKSSLINRLLERRNLARTSTRPGKTRSINFFSVGKDLYFADLPGYGYAAVSQKVRQNWKGLVETYLMKRSNLRSVVVIIDIRRELEGGDLDLLSWLKAFKIHTIIVLTKIDKISKGRVNQHVDIISNQLTGESFDHPLLFSAKTGQGKGEVWKRIQEVIEMKPQTPTEVHNHIVPLLRN
jgi:GTP-binding protein